MASKVYESMRNHQFHNLDEARRFLENAGFEIRDITTQYVTVWEDDTYDHLITLMFGGRLDNFCVAYEF